MTTIRFIILHPLLTMWHLHPFHIGGARRRQWHPTPVLLPGKSHGQRSLVGCSPWGREKSNTTKRLNFNFSLSCIGEGNGNPLHCSCLENPRDGGAWWAAVYGITQSQTWLKRLSSSSSSGKEPACQCRRPKRYGLIPCQEDPLQEGMATHSSILAWRIRWLEDSGGLQSTESQRAGHDWRDLAHTHWEMGSIFPSCESEWVGEGDDTPLQYSCLENPMDGGVWWAAVHGAAKSRTWLSDFPFTFHFHALEKEMVTHSSVLVWRIPGTGEPGGLPSMGSHRVGHDWSDLAAAVTTVEVTQYSF